LINRKTRVWPALSLVVTKYVESAGCDVLTDVPTKSAASTTLYSHYSVCCVPSACHTGDKVAATVVLPANVRLVA